VAEVARLLAALHAQAQAEQEVRRSEERFRRLAEGARDLVYRFRLAPEAAFEYVSPSATAITGYTPEEHYADPQLGLKLVHPDDRDRFMAYLLDPTPGPILLRWIRKEGAVVWTEQQNELVRDAAGQPVAIQGIARDVTERMAAEAALRGAERTAAIGRLAAGVAHELNNPLAWMGSNVHFVQEALTDLEAKGSAAGLGELRQALAEVVDGVDRVRAIVGGLQDLAGPARLAEPHADQVLAPGRKPTPVSTPTIAAPATLTRR
jgi:PAS domain S-box-containing protein